MKKITAVILFVIAIIAAVSFYRALPDIRESGFLSSFVVGKEVTVDKLFPLGDYDGYYYKRLNEITQRAYTAVKEQLVDFPETIEIPAIDTNDLDDLLSAVIYDNPELFMLKRCMLTSDRSRSYFKPIYLMSREDYEECLAELRVAVSASGAGELELSDYEAELYCHDYIMNSCTYNSKEGDNRSNAYGALCVRSATCSGYAKALKLLLDTAGIENFVVLGMASSGKAEPESHMWNCVKIDGDWCYVDLTWDDASDSSGNSHPRHNFFNVNDEYLRKTHYDYSVDVECTEQKHFYYYVMDSYFDTDLNNLNDRIISLIIESDKIGTYEVQLAFSTKQLMDNAIYKLFRQGDIYKDLTKANQTTTARLVTTEINYTTDTDAYILTLKIGTGA